MTAFFISLCVTLNNTLKDKNIDVPSWTPWVIPKSVIYTPKRDDEHPAPFIWQLVRRQSILDLPGPWPRFYFSAKFWCGIFSALHVLQFKAIDNNRFMLRTWKWNLSRTNSLSTIKELSTLQWCPRVDWCTKYYNLYTCVLTIPHYVFVLIIAVHNMKCLIHFSLQPKEAEKMLDSLIKISSNYYRNKVEVNVDFKCEWVSCCLSCHKYLVIDFTIVLFVKFSQQLKYLLKNFTIIRPILINILTLRFT